MNQCKAIKSIRWPSFISRIKNFVLYFMAIVVAGLQGCDKSEKVGVETPVNANPAVAGVDSAASKTDQPVAVKDSVSSLVVSTDANSSKAQQEDSNAEDLSSQSSSERDADSAGDESVLTQAGKLVGDAASKSVKSAAEAGQWVQETLGDATKTGTKSAAETWGWANETFESLKSQGLTSAQSTSQWLGQDWKNMESWQYQIVVLDGEPADVARKLNELGEQGWECFEVTDLTSTSTKFYLKKPTFSYLRQLPFKDVIKLVPLMNAGEK